jgi:N-methylhydantoinase B
MILATSTGGGGYGRPDERAPEAVAADVREGWVSPERARTVYKVEVSQRGELDAAATRVLRAGVSA